MTLQEIILSDLKTAMLSRDSETVSVLRMLQSALKYNQIEQGHELNDQEILQVIRKERKKRIEAKESYAQAGHPDRATTEEREAEILSKYLPAAPDEATIRQYVEQEAAQLAPLEPKHKGELIRKTAEHFAGAADGKVIAQIVTSLF